MPRACPSLTRVIAAGASASAYVRSIAGTTFPASITLHEGDLSSAGVILVVMHRTWSVTSELQFTVAELPRPGMVQIIQTFRDSVELLHLAESITAAELWIAREGYRNARLEIVGAEDGDRVGGADLAA